VKFMHRGIGGIVTWVDPMHWGVVTWVSSWHGLRHDW